VADRADAAQCLVSRRRVADVAVHELEAGIARERGDAARMRARQQRVEPPHLVTRARQRLDNVGPGKPGAAGY
jgi:hypothetical protein